MPWRSGSPVGSAASVAAPPPKDHDQARSAYAAAGAMGPSMATRVGVAES